MDPAKHVLDSGEPLPDLPLTIEDAMASQGTSDIDTARDCQAQVRMLLDFATSKLSSSLKSLLLQVLWHATADNSTPTDKLGFRAFLVTLRDLPNNTSYI